jgi:hypothetical protein
MNGRKYCQRCRGKSYFHIGDLVTFGGNKTHHSHPEIRDMAESSGLFFTGSKKGQRAVVLNMNGATQKHIDSALKIGEDVISPEEFKKKIRRICRGNVPSQIKKVSLKRVVSPGVRVYLQKLTAEEEKAVSRIIKSYGGLVTKRRTKHVKAVVINNNVMTQGIVDFWHCRGVHVFPVSKIRKNS